MPREADVTCWRCPHHNTVRNAHYCVCVRVHDLDHPNRWKRGWHRFLYWLRTGEAA